MFCIIIFDYSVWNTNGRNLISCEFGSTIWNRLLCSRLARSVGFVLICWEKGSCLLCTVTYPTHHTTRQPREINFNQSCDSWVSESYLRKSLCSQVAALGWLKIWAYVSKLPLGAGQVGIRQRVCPLVETRLKSLPAILRPGRNYALVCMCLLQGERRLEEWVPQEMAPGFKGDIP